MTKRIVVYALILINLIFPFCAQAEEGAVRDLEILRVTPSGDDVPANREIVIQFNKAVVPIGRMERTAEEVGISIQPSVACQWRWINTSTLTCQLGEKTNLNLATRYTININTNIKTTEGQALKAPATYTFLTSRPQLRYSWFRNWKSATHPNMYISFDQQVDAESVRQHVYIQDEAGTRHQINLTPTEKSDGSRYEIEPVNELPSDNNIKLRVEPGVKSLVGSELGVEDRDVTIFSTYPEFKFLGIQCMPLRENFVDATVKDGDYDEEGENEDLEPIQILVGEADADKTRCNPLSNISLLFSSPIGKEDLKDFLKVTPDLAGGRKDYDPWEEIYSYVYLAAAHTKGDQYSVSLPTPLKSNFDYQLIAESGKIKDGFGRTLNQAIDFKFSTDHREPKFHLNNQISIIEKETDSSLPLIVTNLDTVSLKFDSFTAAGYLPQRTRTLPLYKARDIAYAFPLDIRESLNGKSGIVQGEIDAKSKALHANRWFFSEVTPFHVHAKLGHFNSLVWVTNFSDGKPVQGARAFIYEGSLVDLKLRKKLGNEGTSDANGIANLPGTVSIDPELKLSNHWQRKDSRLFVQVEKDGEVAIVPISNDFDVSYESSSAYSRPKYGHVLSWGTTAQGVYKLGDNIQYKIFVRNQDVKGFIEAPPGDYKLELIDPTGKTVFERKAVKLSEFSTLEGEIEVSKTWPVGWFQFKLTSSFSKESWEPLRVLVSDFTPSPFHVTTEVNRKSFQSGDRAEVESHARLHAGGPFTDADVRVNATIQSSSLNFDLPALAGFEFGQGDSFDGKELYQVEGKLDSQGEHKTSFTVESVPVVFGNITFESSVRDDRGKYVASSVSRPFYGRDRFVGIKQGDWIVEKNKTSSVEAVVVDADGKPVVGVPIDIAFEFEETKAARVKGSGNAYLTQYTTEWVEVSKCSQKSGLIPVKCDFVPNKAGYFRFVANIKDSHDVVHTSTIDRWAGGDDYVLWSSETGNALEIVPEKNTYQDGDTAKYFIKNPFPGARALVSIERFGIIKSWVTTLEKSAETLEVPVTADLVPGFYFSVVLMSPRVDKPIENKVDLGKPAFKIGYATTNVKDTVKELIVKVKPERDVYKPRETVNVDLQVENREGGTKPVEFAVAVLDESVFDLIVDGKNYFDPFKGFYSLESLDVKNFNIIKQLIGRQKFEKKGANPGGSGGADFDLRSMFKFVPYWNPSIKADSSGKAHISFQLPDNLTGWKVLTLAATKTDQLGLGEGHFKSNKATEVRGALPNQVMEGDSFVANFTLMNRTDKARTLDVSMSASGEVEGTPAAKETVSLEPYKRVTVHLPIKATRFGEIKFDVRAFDAQDSDGLQLTLPVLKRVVLETAANYATTTEASASEKILFPNEIRTDVGTIGVTLSPSVIGGIDNAFKYIKDYPYACWEQQITKAIMASHYLMLKSYLAKDFTWPEADSLVKTTLKNAELYQAPNGGMAFYISRNEYASPYLSAYTELVFGWLKSRGYEVPQKVEDNLIKYLEEFLMKDTYPSFYSKGLASSVRAVALAALAESKKVNLKDIERFKDSVPVMDIFAKAHYLLAASKVQGTDAIQKSVVDAILATSNETGGKLVFSEQYDTLYDRILASIPRSQCAVLSGLLSAYDNYPGKNSLSSDLFFKIVRSITQYRLPRGHWENTQENVFCLNALIDYSQKFEKTKPNFVAEVSLDSEKLGSGKMNDYRDEALTIERDIKEGDSGRSATLEIKKEGPGRVYYNTKLTYSPKELKKDPVNAGIEVHREYSVERNKAWELLKAPYKINVGELVRVDLFVSIPAVRNFVVVDDAVPGGLEPVNKDLATASQVDVKKGEFEHAKGSFWYGHDDWVPFKFLFWSFYHQELRHNSVRFYSEYLPAGNYHLSYTAQAIAPGSFNILPLRAEEMYDTDVYGLGVPEILEVK